MNKITTLMVPAVLAAALQAGGQTPTPPANPFASFATAWRDDPVWYDGLAEIAIYDATRTIYGKQRHYKATLYTNKEKASSKTFTKSDSNSGREVFKHHLREDVATENYDYHFSTMAYVGTSDLKSLKIDMGSQEDCGATFKQYINHAPPGQPSVVQWRQFSYFPKEGHKRGQYEATNNFTFANSLSLVLRGYPFAEPRDISLTTLADQRSNKLTDAQPIQTVVQYVALETIDIPLGQIEAHHLRVSYISDESTESVIQHYWFAADASLLHVLVQYTGPNGQTYRLRSVERRAYWKR
jgi:hypothetical protein